MPIRTLFVALCFFIPARQGGDVLLPPVSLENRPLRDGQVDRYVIDLRAGDALVGAVNQRGIDVIVTLRDPRGRVALEADSPNGSDGPESLAYVAPSGGAFVVEIRPFAPGRPPGHYDFDLEPVHAATTRELNLAEAQRLYADGMATRGEALAGLGRGRWQETMKRYNDARASAERALALRLAARGEDHYDVAAVHVLLGLVDDEVGDYPTGVTHFGRAVEILERLFGPDHPNTLTARSDLGYLLLAAGRWQEAADTFQRTIERRERLGTMDASANGLGGLGLARYRLADYAAAEGTMRREIAFREKARETGGALPAARLRLGETLVARNDVEQAVTLCDAVRAAVETVPDGDQLMLANAHACLANAALERHDVERALDHARRAAALREACQGPDHPATAEALTGLGRALRRQRDLAQAEQILARAERIQLSRLGPAHPLLADTLSELAATVAEMDPGRARVLYDRVIAVRSAALPAAHPAIADARAARARLDSR